MYLFYPFQPSIHNRFWHDSVSYWRVIWTRTFILNPLIHHLEVNERISKVGKTIERLIQRHSTMFLYHTFSVRMYLYICELCLIKFPFIPFYYGSYKIFSHLSLSFRIMPAPLLRIEVGPTNRSSILSLRSGSNSTFGRLSTDAGS